MKRLILMLLCCICGCAPVPNIVRLNSTFDPIEANKYLLPGTNKIIGSAVIRQQGGSVVTSAGCKVVLIPVTAYSTERMQAIYNSTEKGYSSSANITFEPNYPEYQSARIETTGDAQGMFEFDNIADGEFYAVTTITWSIQTHSILIGWYPAQQGGNLMQRVKVSGGETKKIVLSP